MDVLSGSLYFEAEKLNNLRWTLTSSHVKKGFTDKGVFTYRREPFVIDLWRLIFIVRSLIDENSLKTVKKNYSGQTVDALRPIKYQSLSRSQ